MRLLITIVSTIGFVSLQVTAQEIKNVTENLNSNKTDYIENTRTRVKVNEMKSLTPNTSTKNEINTKTTYETTPADATITANVTPSSITQKINYTTSSSLAPPLSSLSPSLSTFSASPVTEAIPTSTSPTLTVTPLPSSPKTEATISTTTTSTTPPSTPTSSTTIAEEETLSSNQYCEPSLCEFYNGSHTNIKPHIACKNSGNFGPACGSQPHLLKMSERRRNLILDLHNLARSRIASGQVDDYKSASHMPQLKWNNELEYLASLHVKRCRFEHDLCHNTPRFPYSGQNIGYFWKGANITSHSKRMKNFIVNWYKEHRNANQTFIDSFHLHPDNKLIGHFTAMVGDRVHHVGCAAIRFYESNLTKILMTCNYDYNNFSDEPVYETGPTASKCTYKISEKYPGLCDWKKPEYEYETTEEETENSRNLVL